MNGSKKLFILDSFALIYRAHFALHKYVRTNSQGLDVSALLGFSNTLVEILQKQSPTHVVAAFDSKAPTWRKRLYPDYKIQRQAQPEAITNAIPCSKELLEAFRIPHIAVDGYEADDIIGSLAKRAVEANFDVYIVSADKDLGQLVNSRVAICKPGSGNSPAVILREKEILAQWGIKRVDQIPDMLGLWGDVADNIPGVPGVGSKTAQKLLAQYGSLERLFENITEVKGVLQEWLRTHEERAKLSKKLATIAVDLPLDFDFARSAYTGPDPKQLYGLLERFEFRTLSKRLFPAGNPVGNRQLGLFGTEEESADNKSGAFLGAVGDAYFRYTCEKANYILLENLGDIADFVQEMQKKTLFCFDTETTGLDPRTARLLGISFAYKPGLAYYISIPNDSEGTKEILETLRPIFSDQKILKIGQNLKYDLLVLRQYKLAVEGPFFDTMIAHHLLLPGASRNLNALARKYLKYAPIEIEELIGPKGRNQLRLDEVPQEKLVVYACEDADITLQLYYKLAPLLTKEAVGELFEEIEMKLLPVLVNMECRGVALDTEMLAEVSRSLAEELQALEKSIYALVGSTFNIDSPKQLGKVLFEELNVVDKPVKTAKGQYTTSEPTLRRLLKEHPVISQVLRYREAKKLKSTYVDALPALLGKDKRLHTSYHQGFVTTGRLSSSNPNLQNIPIRTVKGKSVRRAFVPGNNYDALLSADYSQIELRIMAEFAGDAAMIEAFKEGKDIHTMTAAQIFHTSEAEVSPAMRRKAKMVNFGIIYGISPFGLAERLDISRGEAAAIIENYFVAFPGVRAYMDRTIAEARELGYAKTLLGRKRMLPDICSKNAVMRSFAERNAINMRIQGTAAELIQAAMIKIEAWLAKTGLGAQMILQVHDELVFEVCNEAIPVLKERIPAIMAGALSFRVPMAVSVGVGKDWLAAH